MLEVSITLGSLTTIMRTTAIDNNVDVLAMAGSDLISNLTFYGYYDDDDGNDARES